MQLSRVGDCLVGLAGAGPRGGRAPLAAMADPAGGLRRDLVLHLHGGAVDHIGV